MGRKNEDTMFEPSEYNDKGFAVAFLVQLVGLILWVVYAAAAGKFQVVEGAQQGPGYAFLQGLNHGVAEVPSQADSVQYLIYLAFLSIIVATVFATIWMFLLKAFPVQMVKASMVMFPCVFAALLAYSLATGGNLIGPALMTGLATLFVYWYWDRADFTGMIVKVVVEIYDKCAIIYAIGFLTIVLQAAWMVVWILSVIPLFIQGQGVLVLPLLLSLFWGQHVISNILYVSASGVVARHYFGIQKEEAATISFKHACTNYLGSICFGSLLIAIVQTLTEMCRKAKEQSEEDDNAVGACLACVAMCFLSCLESLVQIFNEFSFVYVAIYGMPFYEAALKTYDLITSSDALIKDQITSIVTLCGCLGVAVACAAFNWLAAMRLALATNFRVGAGFVGFIVGFAIMCVVSRILEGGCTTMIVCFEEEPDKLDSELKPSFYERKGIQKRKM